MDWRNLQFRTIDAEQDRETVLAFFRDTQMASVGNEDHFDDEDYLNRIKKHVSVNPDGFVLALEDGKPIGQLELQIKSYQDRKVGYISLIYVTAACRGKNYSKKLLAYAENYFTGREMGEYHLRVSPANRRALRFYEKSGLAMLGEEQSSMGYPVYRMGKKLQGKG
ncbi:MAG TPA: GNAT family N-acetyltransferase [Bacillales bacterium]|nr:GNAT family N-acetyltransferase [Bacillales bacterium]